MTRSATMPASFSLSQTVQVSQDGTCYDSVPDSDLTVDEIVEEKRFNAELVRAVLDKATERDLQLHALHMAKLGLPNTIAKVWGIDGLRYEQVRL